MSRDLSRLAIMLSAVYFVLAIGFPLSAHAAARLGPSALHSSGSVEAAGSGEPSLAALMLTDADLPVGFRFYTPLTGHLDARRALIGLGLTVDVSQFGTDTWVRVWVSARATEQVGELTADLGTREAARAYIASFESTARTDGMVTEPIAGPVHFEGLTRTGRLHGIGFRWLYVPMARGPYLFLLGVLAPVPSSASANRLMGNLAATQWRQVPNNTPGTANSNPGASSTDPGGAAGAFLATLILYLGIASVISYSRKDLRRRPRYTPSGAALRWPEAHQVRDVSSAAGDRNSTANRRFVVQLTGLTVAACGADPFVIAYWYIYLIIGLMIVWAGGRFIDPGGTGRGKNRASLAGSRKILVAFMLSAASVLILLGLLFLLSYARSVVQPPGAVSAQNQQQSLQQAVQVVIPYIGLTFVALGAIGFRFARRLGSIEARRLMLRDTRPPVLYLRSFGDDGLRLWTSSLGRPSLIERFRPGRSDAFEEVLARYLSVFGPVIAVNPPGTKLAPLGAARETLDPADWQSAVAAWMKQSTLIVFITPPERVTEGLLWELKAVSAQRLWDKTLIIVPPVFPEQLLPRWQALLDACARLWPFTYPLPVADPRTLVLAFRNDEWAVVIANEQTEWSYSAALKQAVDGSPRPAAARAYRGE